jgi:copper resistance protein B
MILGDRLEVAAGEDSDLALWDFQGWHGTDERRLWIKSEGEYSFDEDEFEAAELQVLYSRPVSPYFDLQGGVRHDFEPGSGRSFATLGLQGLAPYWFEVDAAIFLSEDGDASARIEVEYDILFTQRLIAQLRSEVEVESRNVPELGLGSGLSSAEFGVRLRYEIRREIAPYVGVSWDRAYGGTAEAIRATGNHPRNKRFVVGLRFWR